MTTFDEVFQEEYHRPAGDRAGRAGPGGADRRAAVMGRGTHDWYTVVTFGSYGGNVAFPPRGPWRGVEAAQDAVDRWAERVGSEAGSFRSATSMRVVGPFCTRQQAAGTTIGNWPSQVCRHGMTLSELARAYGAQVYEIAAALDLGDVGADYRVEERYAREVLDLMDEQCPVKDE